MKLPQGFTTGVWTSETGPVAFTSRAGAGPPIVCVHGAAGGRVTWYAVLEALAAELPGRALFALDLPGHGDSPVHEGPVTVAGYAALVAGFAAHAGGTHGAVIAGHSMGGVIGLEMAITRPESIAALVMISSSAKVRVARFMLGALAEAPERFAALRREYSYGPATPPEIAGAFDAIAMQCAPAQAVADFQAIDHFDRSADLPRVAQPVLVLTGDADQVLPAKLSRKLAAGLPHAQLIEYPGVGHMLPGEKPHDVAGAIARFAGWLGV